MAQPHWLVLADSILALDDKPSSGDWLQRGVPMALTVDIKQGRRFSKHSWVPPDAALQMYEGAVIFCALNDACGPGPRTKTHIDSTTLERVKSTLTALAKCAKSVVFAAMGDWHSWSPGFSQGKLHPNSEADFTHCLDEIITAAASVPGVRVRRFIHELHGLPKYDPWHFGREAADGLKAIVIDCCTSHHAVVPTAVVRAVQAQGESPSGEQGQFSKDSAQAQGESPSNQFSKDPANQAQGVSEDAWISARVQKVADVCRNEDLLALLVEASTSFPSSQKDLSPLLHDRLFYDVLQATCGKKSKIETRYTTWRFFFDETAEGLQSWVKIREAHQKAKVQGKSLVDQEALAKVEAEDREARAKVEAKDAGVGAKRVSESAVTQPEKKIRATSTDSLQGFFNKHDEHLQSLRIVSLNFGSARKKQEHNDVFYDFISAAFTAKVHCLLLQEASGFVFDETQWRVLRSDANQDLVSLFHIDYFKVDEVWQKEVATFEHKPGKATRMMVVHVDAPCAQLDLLNIHLHHTVAKRQNSEQFLSTIEQVAELLKQERFVAMAGDFNQSTYEGRLLHAVNSQGCCMKQLVQNAEEPCDIFVNSNFEGTGCSLHFDEFLLQHGSHHPVAATINLANGLAARHACAGCGWTKDATFKGSGHFSNYWYCQRCWQKWTEF